MILLFVFRLCIGILALCVLGTVFLWGFVVGRAEEVAHWRGLLEQPDPCWEARPPPPAPLTLTPVVWCATVEDLPRP
jgi:hypothetical protein